MKSLTSFLFYLTGFIGTGFFVSVGNWASAAMFFMLFLDALAQQITEAIENKKS